MTEARQALAEALRRIKALTAGSGGNARHFPSNTCYLVNEIASKALLASLPPVNTDQNGGSDIGEGNHDCLAKRRPDEPMFILLGRDPDAHNIVRSWAERRLAAGGDPEHCQMGLDTAERMQAYAADPVNAPASAPPASSYPPLAATPQPAEPGALREEVARIIHEHQGNGDPDELIHHPAAKSWDEPTEPRWSQWLEIADAILNLTQADARRIAELERQIGSWRSQCMDEEERRNTAEARAEALSAEVERLKAGLEEIGATANNNTVADGYRLARIATKARRLLTDPTPTTEGES